MFYESLQYYIKKYDQTERKYAFRCNSMKEFEQWKAVARDRLREISGFNKCIKTNLKAKRISEEVVDGLLYQVYILETEPGIQMPFYIIQKESLKNVNNRPVMLALHGHGGGKEVTANDDFTKKLAKKGIIVVCPDERGSGERREFPQQDEKRSNSHRELAQVAIGFGQSFIGLVMWDLTQLINFLKTLDIVDSNKMGTMGMSGGGQQSLWLAALNDSIKIVITSGYFYGFKESLIELPHNCACNFVPYMWETMDTGDLGALIAPRPIFVESGKKDPLNGKNGIDNVISQLDITKDAYALFGKESNVKHSVHEGAHEFSGKGMLQFILKGLG